MLDVVTLLKNIRDLVRFIVGFFQSLWLLGRLKPSVIFIKGGYVGVPVGLAAAIRRIPYVTHDSDAIPGLANRLIARWAQAHAVANNKTLYKYPQEKTHEVGIPLSPEYKPVSDEMKHLCRAELGLEKYSQVLFVIGGGLGAQRVNKAVADISPQLLKTFPELVIVHAVGTDNEWDMQNYYDETVDPTNSDRIIVKGFVRDGYRYSAAADVIITRAGATNLAEFAAQGKACIIVPHPNLTGGHQLKNAAVLEESGAAVVVQQSSFTENPSELLEAVESLLQDSPKRERLGRELMKLAHTDASIALAQLLISNIKSPKKP